MNESEELEEQIKAIFYQYHQDVYRFLIYFTRNRNDAEDLTQEVFIKVLKGLPHFEQKAKLKTWILSIARHVAIDHYRKMKVRSLFSSLGKGVESTSEEGLPEIELEYSEQKRELEEALLKLKPKYRMVIILRGIKELSIKETAEILAWNERMVKVNYHRGLKKLQEIMTSLQKGGEEIGSFK